MFNPKILSNENVDERLGNEDLKKIKGGAPDCNSYWDTHSKCKHVAGCITSSWTSIEKPKK